MLWSKKQGKGYFVIVSNKWCAKVGGAEPNYATNGLCVDVITCTGCSVEVCLGHGCKIMTLCLGHCSHGERGRMTISLSPL